MDELKLTPEMIQFVRETWFKKFCEEMAAVQPMDSTAFSELYKYAKENGMSEKQLIAEGYEPVCQYSRLMWIKKASNE